MPDIFMLSDKNRARQTISLCEQLRGMGYEGRLGILLLDSIERKTQARLFRCNAELEIADIKFQERNIKRSGLKMWLPHYFRAQDYVLLDTDHIILSKEFFNAVKCSRGRVGLVQESEVVWEENFKGVPYLYNDIIGKSILQTGLISIERQLWQEIFADIEKLIINDSSEYGDQVALNQFFYINDCLLHSLPEEVSLVLRPSGKGRSTKAHIRYLMWDSRCLMYKGSFVLSIHYTNSDGKLHRLEDFKSLEIDE